MPDFDVVIVGAGLVGASLAANLRGSGLRVAVVEPSPPCESQSEAWDSRIYAVGPGSVTFLEGAGAWQRLDATRIQPVFDMHVRGDDGASRLDFSNLEAGQPVLAWIVESSRLQDALWRTLDADAGIELRCPASCTSIAWQDDAAEIALQDGERVRTRLVVGADGAESWVRKQAGIAAEAHPYRQLGVVANFSCAEDHRGVARQWFRPDGVLALLPLPGNRVSMVWSTWEAEGRALVALAGEALCERVREASRDTLGALSLITPAAAFPLRRIRVARLVGPRVALIGDAAHVVHPLAGQGVNLGFRDARELATLLRQRGPAPDCGALTFLRRYERARAEDVLTMMLTTDLLQKLFNTNLPSLPALRNWGLRLTGRLAPIRSLLIQHAVG
jgi:ubiquinone biosynthesis UbiH/UbiF/VisC/COQ6 family hydroxylase